MFAVETRQLGRTFKGRDKANMVVALEAVDLQVEVGEVRGLLGPNGAGKTTLAKILSTVLLPTAGRALVMGKDVASDTRAVRRLVGVVFGGDRGLYPHLTARQNLDYWAALYEVPGREAKTRVAALLDRVGLAERADQKVNTFSRGMKQRLHLARGLVANAKVLLLDEPTVGMDPLAARDFRALVGALRSEGRTILLTTHDMAEAEAVCDRVALIDRGRLLAVETPASLGRLVAQNERIDFEGGTEMIIGTLRALPGVGQVHWLHKGARSRIELSDQGAAHGVLAALVAHGVTSISTSRPSLEEVYVHVIGDRGLKV